MESKGLYYHAGTDLDFFFSPHVEIVTHFIRILLTYFLKIFPPKKHVRQHAKLMWAHVNFNPTFRSVTSRSRTRRLSWILWASMYRLLPNPHTLSNILFGLVITLRTQQHQHHMNWRISVLFPSWMVKVSILIWPFSVTWPPSQNGQPYLLTICLLWQKACVFSFYNSVLMFIEREIYRERCWNWVLDTSYLWRVQGAIYITTPW